MPLPTIHLNLANFRLYKDGEELKKREDKFDSQPTSQDEQIQFKDVKDILQVVRMAFWEDGAVKIGIRVFFINSEVYATLKRILCFLAGVENDKKTKIKYRKLELFPSEDLEKATVQGE